MWRLVPAGPIAEIETHTTAYEEQTKTDTEAPQGNADQGSLLVMFRTSLV